MNTNQTTGAEYATAPIKAYTASELRELYGVSRHTFSRWTRKHLEGIAPIEGTTYSAEQVKLIFEKLDAPPAKQ